MLRLQRSTTAAAVSNTQIYNARRAHHLHAHSGNARGVCGAIPYLTTMNNPPNPDLHTLYDDELGERLFYSCEPIAYDVGGQLIIVSPNFLSDGLSIPAAARPLINTPKAPQWIGAGILHDWLYSRCETHEHISRRRCDTLLLLAMKLYGVGIIKRRIIFWSVRTFGRLAFRKRTPKFATNHHHD